MKNPVHSRLFPAAARWLCAALLVGALAAPAARAGAGATLSPSLQGKYKITKITATILKINYSVPVPSSAKSYTLTMGPKGLTVLTSTQGEKLVTYGGFNGPVKVVITKATPTALSAKATGGGVIANGIKVTFSATSMTATLNSSGLTIVTNVSGSVTEGTLHVSFNGKVTVVLTK